VHITLEAAVMQDAGLVIGRRRQPSAVVPEGVLSSGKNFVYAEASVGRPAVWASCTASSLPASVR